MLDKSFSSALSYTSRPYSEAMVMHLTVTYTPYATSSREQTGDVIAFAQFEEGNLLTETCNNTESVDESDSKSIMMSEQNMVNGTGINNQQIIRKRCVVGEALGCAW